MLALLLAGSANAATITVNASGGYTRIQDAIDNASAGDTILVYSGIYHENVNVTKQLTLRGVGNPVAGIKVTSNNNTLSGNNASNNGNEYGGFGIHLQSSRNNMLGGNNASNNYYGIYLSFSSSNTIYNNIFNNTKNVDWKSKVNTWNTTKQSGTNIIGGSSAATSGQIQTEQDLARPARM